MASPLPSIFFFFASIGYFCINLQVIDKLPRFWLKLMLQWLLCQLESKLRIWVPESWKKILLRHRTPPPSANTFDTNPSNDAKKPQETPKIRRKVFDGINMTQGRWDQSRNFKIFDHIFTGSNYDKLSHEFNVTLATQSSLDKLYWLGQVRIILLVHILTEELSLYCLKKWYFVFWFLIWILR